MNAEWNWQAPAITAPLGQAGRVGVNHDQPSQATTLYIHRLDTGNVDRSTMLERLNTDHVIYLQQKTQASSWHRYKLTGRAKLNNECWVLPVTTYAGSAQGTEPANAAPVIVSLPGDA